MKFQHPSIQDGGIVHPIHGEIRIVGGIFEGPQALGDEMGLEARPDDPPAPMPDQVDEPAPAPTPTTDKRKPARPGRAKG